MIDAWPIQVAMYEALTAAPASYAVYDAVPQGASYPYIVLGEYIAEPDDELAVPTLDAFFLLHVWSRNPGKAEAHAMLAFIRARLDGQPVAGTWACTEDRAEIFEDESSTEAARIYHGFARYRVRSDSVLLAGGL